MNHALGHGDGVSVDADLHQQAADLLEGLLKRSHLSRPSDVGTVVVEELIRTLGATSVVVYMVNHEYTSLMPLASKASPTRAAQEIDASQVGEAFITTTIVTAPGSAAGRRRVFVPLIDGTDRIGALELEVSVDATGEVTPDLVLVLERYAHAVAQLLITKRAYGDALELAQRTRSLDLGAELLWSALPPMTFATDGLVITTMLEPAYENGGDAFDYAVNAEATHLAVLDGVGHGLAAAGLSTFALATYRHSRRTGRDLPETYAAMDAAVAGHFGDERFVTAVLARLDPATGLLRWVNAGHPPPLLLRAGQVFKVLDGGSATPLGLPMFATEVVVNEEQLEPGDSLVLYTDGVTEARRADGGLVGLDGLQELIRRGGSTHSPPETLRLLRRTLLADGGAVLRDDATAMLVAWQGGAERELLPQSV
jgi:hypothetical protein